MPSNLSRPGDNETLIKVEGVSKKFCLSLKKSLWYGLKDMGRELAGRRHGGDGALRPKEFWAVKDVGFELKRGECLGLIGLNGAGKTTLLKMLNGLIKPDAGRIEMRGRVGALIALGAGFNPILTGRENIYVNASVLGLSKREIDAKLEEIIDFAEIGDFIDTPVQNYSSGMAVRLGFSIATTLDPDILLLDEVLAVGDAGFRHKCYSRIGRMQERAAVIFVSHSMEFVSQICDRAFLMDHGRGGWHDDVMDAVSAYNALSRTTGSGATKGMRAFYPPVTDVQLHLPKTQLGYGDELAVRLVLHTNAPVRRPVISLAIRNESGTYVAAWRTPESGEQNPLPAGRNRVDFSAGPLWLVPGKYFCTMGVNEEGNAEHKVWLYDQAEFTMTGTAKPMGPLNILLPYRGHQVTPLVPGGSRE